MTAAGFCPRCRGGVVAGECACRWCGIALIPAPGWYPDPQSAAGWRFWNGAAWTVRLHPPAPAAQAGQDAQETSASPDAAVVEMAPPRAPGLPGLGVAITGFAAGFASAVGVAAAWHALGKPGGVVLVFCVSELALWLGMLGAVVYVSRRRGTGSLTQDFDFRFRRRDLSIGLLAAAVARGTTVIVAVPVYGAFHDLLRNPQVGLRTSALHGGLLAVFAVTACVGAPLVEEMFFRGLIQTRLVALHGPAVGIAVTSVMFGAAHLIGWRGPASLLAAVAIAGGGAVLGYTRQRTGRLGTSIVAHSVFNAVVVLFLAVAAA